MQKIFTISLSLGWAVTLFIPQPLNAQSSCQASIDFVTNEIRAKGVRRSWYELDRGEVNHPGNPTNRTDLLGFALSPYNKAYTNLNRRSSYIIDNIMSSPVLMKSWADKIVANCNNIAVVDFGADQSDWVVSYAIQADGKTKKRECIDWSTPPSWNQEHCM